MKMIGTTRMPDKEQTEVFSGHLEIAAITTNDPPNIINRLRSLQKRIKDIYKSQYFYIRKEMSHIDNPK